MAHELGKGFVTPQDLSRFILALFFNLMGTGFKCVARMSLANLSFTFFLALFTFIDAEFNFLQVGALLSGVES